jgi:hypothetical protein
MFDSFKVLLHEGNAFLDLLSRERRCLVMIVSKMRKAQVSRNRTSQVAHVTHPYFLLTMLVEEERCTYIVSMVIFFLGQSHQITLQKRDYLGRSKLGDAAYFI